MKKLNFSMTYFNYISEISKKIDKEKIENFVEKLLEVKKNRGRLFFLGVGGSAGNCSHAVNDFRKLCNLESYTVADNVSELTARINDEGWDNSFKDWLVSSNINKKDAVIIFSVGGGNKKKNVSTNLIKAIDFSLKRKVQVLGIVGRDDGYLFKKGNCVITVPIVSKKLITPLSEAFQAVIWHYFVSHPKLQVKKTKW